MRLSVGFFTRQYDECIPRQLFQVKIQKYFAGRKMIKRWVHLVQMTWIFLKQVSWHQKVLLRHKVRCRLLRHRGGRDLMEILVQNKACSLFSCSGSHWEQFKWCWRLVMYKLLGVVVQNWLSRLYRRKEEETFWEEAVERRWRSNWDFSFSILVSSCTPHAGSVSPDLEMILTYFRKDKTLQDK